LRSRFQGLPFRQPWGFVWARPPAGPKGSAGAGPWDRLGGRFGDPPAGARTWALPLRNSIRGMPEGRPRRPESGVSYGPRFRRPQVPSSGLPWTPFPAPPGPLLRAPGAALFRACLTEAALTRQARFGAAHPSRCGASRVGEAHPSGYGTSLAVLHTSHPPLAVQPSLYGTTLVVRHIPHGTAHPSLYGTSLAVRHIPRGTAYPSWYGKSLVVRHIPRGMGVEDKERARRSREARPKAEDGSVIFFAFLVGFCPQSLL
jgi:hypothetical protein